MIRKRAGWTRAYAKRKRPKHPAPKGGWVIAELSRLSGVPVRRIRYYVAQDMIRPLERRGTATRYPRMELLRLLAIPLLRAKRLKLDGIRRELERLGETELLRMIAAEPMTAELAAALEIVPDRGATNPDSYLQPLTPLKGAKVPRDSTLSRLSSTETWHRVQLLPGLELLVSTVASPAVRAAAAIIVDEYVGGA
jgi:DNA-binding transcriptional MerR regulator